MGITGRAAIDGEKRFLHQWTEWGFGPEAVHMAYERTLLRTGAMKWPYCNGILRRWNDKNAHTPEEIDQVENAGRRRQTPPRQQAPTAMPQPAKPGEPPRVPRTARKNAEWMRKVLEESEG